ncbi:MAG TPA: TetR/AcrR family transcriptional regulator [Gemmatimonadaceae bacterium]|jgi:TetR/AcrR family transcriptional repressor of nem operon
MKVTREKAAENRAALVREAGRLFRERGIDGVGVAEVSKAAGLTHGALYAQFSSKEALAAEALAAGLETSGARLAKIVERPDASLGDLLDYYVSRRHRDDLAFGCPLAASASEIARQDRSVSARFVEGFERMTAAVEATLVDLPPETRHQRALTIVAAEIGAIAVARASAKSDLGLSNEILAAARTTLEQLGEEPPRARRRRRRVGR